jgi:hypothetical protein
VLEHVRVDESYRRHGYGRVLVAAAQTLGRDYDWLTTAVNKSIEARAFWARIGPLGRPCRPTAATFRKPRVLL